MGPAGTIRGIEIDLSPDLTMINADLKGARQMLINLIGNALKFTSEDGQVGVRSFLDPKGHPVICVWDTGHGIPKHKIEHVRRPFQQVESVFHRTHDGVGLGLYITEQIIQLHGGTLLLESTEGVGTTVTLRFDVAANASHMTEDCAPVARSLTA